MDPRIFIPFSMHAFTKQSEKRSEEMARAKKVYPHHLHPRHYPSNPWIRTYSSSFFSLQLFTLSPFFVNCVLVRHEIVTRIGRGEEGLIIIIGIAISITFFIIRIESGTEKRKEKRNSGKKWVRHWNWWEEMEWVTLFFPFLWRWDDLGNRRRAGGRFISFPFSTHFTFLQVFPIWILRFHRLDGNEREGEKFQTVCDRHSPSSSSSHLQLFLLVSLEKWSSSPEIWRRKQKMFFSRE